MSLATVPMYDIYPTVGYRGTPLPHPCLTPDIYPIRMDGRLTPPLHLVNQCLYQITVIKGMYVDVCTTERRTEAWANHNLDSVAPPEEVSEACSCVGGLSELILQSNVVTVSIWLTSVDMVN
jgi:hypothetical protein